VEKVYDIKLPESNSRSTAKSIVLDFPVNVIFTQPKNKKSVSVRANLPEKMYKVIDVSSNSAGEIIITHKKKSGNYNAPRNTHPVIYIECGAVNDISITSTGSFAVKGTLDNCNPLKVNVTSTGSFDADKIICHDIDLNISGTGSIDVGSVETNGNLDCSISGTGSFDCRDMVVKKDTKLTINGTGDIDIDNIRTESCTAEILGTGDITLAGKAHRVAYNVDGTGSIYARGLVADVADRVVVTGPGNIDFNFREIKDIKYRNDGSRSKYNKAGKIINYRR